MTNGKVKGGPRADAGDPDKAEKGEDAPIKADDHSLDSSRYVVHTTEAAWRPQLAEAA